MFGFWLMNVLIEKIQSLVQKEYIFLLERYTLFYWAGTFYCSEQVLLTIHGGLTFIFKNNDLAINSAFLPHVGPI